MRNTHRSPGHVGGAIVAALVLAGCAVLNPHVRWNPPDSSNSHGSKATNEDSLRYGIAYADNAKAAYKNALGSQAKLSSWLGIGLIPLAAAAGGLGVTGGSSAAIAAVGLTGAGGYGVGQWLTSKPAQRAWVAGYNATSCAIDAVFPLLDVENDSGFKTDIETIGPKVTPVEQDIIRLKMWQGRPDESLKDLLAQAAAAQAAAEQLVSAARSTTAKAAELRLDAQTAGRRLKEAVDRIGGQVSAALVETGPDLQGLYTIIAGLGRSYGRFTQTADGIKATPAPQPSARKDAEAEKHGLSSDRTALVDDLKTLSADSAALAQVVDKVANRVNAVAARKPVDALKGCGVSVDQLAIPLSVDPPGAITITQGTAATVGRVIKGGSTPYAVTFPGTVADGLTVRQTEPFGPAFVVQTTDKTPATTAAVHATDRSGNHAFIEIRVETKAASEMASANTPAVTLKDFAENLPKTSGLVGADNKPRIIYQDALAEGDKKLKVAVGLEPNVEVTDEEIRADLAGKPKAEALKDVTILISRVPRRSLSPLDKSLVKFAMQINGGDYPLPGGAGTVSVDRADLKEGKIHVATSVRGTTAKPLTQPEVDALGNAVVEALPLKTSGIQSADIVVDTKTAVAGTK